MPVLKSFLSLVLIFILALLVLGFFLPKKDKVIAVRQIDCSPDLIFNQVNDLKQWDLWSPWYKMDSNMVKRYSKISVGKGASYSWKGNSRVGQGELSILRSVPSTKIDMLLNYNYEGGTSSGFEFIPTDRGTEVQWWLKMNYPTNPVLKLFFGGFSYVIMNHFLQKDFNSGLENLSQTCK